MTETLKRHDRIKLSFEQTSVTLSLTQIVPLKTLRPGTKESKKYAQILGSIRVIGLVEAPVVTPDRKKSGRYFLLDGHLRIEALKDLAIESVECLVSTDDEAYTYNKRINRISAVQEHRMIKRAIVHLCRLSANTADPCRPCLSRTCASTRPVRLRARYASRSRFGA